MFGKDGGIMGDAGAETVRTFDARFKRLTTREASEEQMKMP